MALVTIIIQQDADSGDIELKAFFEPVLKNDENVEQSVATIAGAHALTAATDYLAGIGGEITRAVAD